MMAKTSSSLKEDETQHPTQDPDEEINAIYQKCLISGLNGLEIYQITKPLREIVMKENKKRKWKRNILFGIFFLCLWSATKIDWSPVVLSYYGRSALISMLPYWDWTQYYYHSCIIENPHYEPRRLYDEDCEVCESMNELMIKSDLGHVDISEDYLKNDVPIVLEDSIQNWVIDIDALSIYNISKVLIDADKNGNSLPCAFSSNLRLRGENYFKVLLYKLQLETIVQKSFYAHWENCEKFQSKALRGHIGHPPFLPPMVDNIDPNWVIISANYNARNYKPLQVVSDMMWLMQINGSNNIRFSPRSPCNQTCQSIDFLLTKRQTVLFTSRLWTLHYLPGKDNVNIAIGGGGSFYDF
ncbi:hypothetical protein CHUAL_000116 [Chamberlinius hualienensis]